MRIKPGFAKREIAGAIIVVPVGKASADFNGMITLNESGSFFWDCLSKETTIEKVLDAVINEYDVDRQTAQRDIEKFIEMLRSNNLIEE